MIFSEKKCSLEVYVKFFFSVLFTKQKKLLYMYEVSNALSTCCTGNCCNTIKIEISTN